MKNIWRLYVSDLKHLFRNVVSGLIAIGLVVLPSIFAWYNVIACWNVFDNTGKLTVAVANSDVGYESDLMPLKVNVGDEVVAALRANDDIGWQVTDEEDAKDGVAAGRYYAAIVIPPEFSRDMMTFYANDAETAQIVYYSNEKRNAIAPVITSKGATSVSTAVNETFAQTLADVSLGLAKSLGDYLDESGAAGTLSSLADGIDSAASMMGQAASALSLYSAVVKDIQAAAGDVAGIARSAKDMLVRAQASVASAADASAAAAAELRQKADAVSSQLDEAERRLAQLEAEAAALVGQLAPSVQARIESELATARQDVAEVKASVQGMVTPQLVALSQDVQVAKANVNDGLVAAQSACDTVAASADESQASLGAVASKLDGTAAELEAKASEMRELTTKIRDAVAANDLESVRDILATDTTRLAEALAAPVALERVAVFPADNFGSAMAPFYTALALFIGSLLIVVAVRPAVSDRAARKLTNPKPHQLFLGRFGVLATISFAQSTVMGLGNIFFLQVQVAYPWLLMLCFWLSGLVFTFLIYALVAVFANLGKAIAVLLLIVQVTGCGGSYPLQILPSFIQTLSPWLPLTHTVSAMRSAMFGMYQADFWVQMGMLALFLIPAVILGLVLRRPLSVFMSWYVKQVDKSELVS